MRCDEFRELASLAEPPAAEASAYAEHRAACAACAADAALFARLRASGPQPAPRDLMGFAARVRARATGEDLRRTFSPVKTGLAAAGLALGAAAAVAFLIVRVAPPPRVEAEVPAAVAEAGDAEEGSPDTLGDNPVVSMSDEEIAAMDEVLDDVLAGDEET